MPTNGRGGKGQLPVRELIEEDLVPVATSGRGEADCYALTSATRRRRKRRSGSVCASSRARSYSVQRLVGSAEAAQQVGTCRVEVLVAVEVEPVDEGKPRFRALRLGHCDRAVQLDDR